MTERRALLFIAIAGVAAILFSAWAALAHPGFVASWIGDNPKTSYCCNKDCGLAPANAVYRIPGAWVIAATGQQFRDGDPHLHMSIDLAIWWCQPSPPQVSCLFVPPAGA